MLKDDNRSCSKLPVSWAPADSARTPPSMRDDSEIGVGGWRANLKREVGFCYVCR